MTDGVIAAAIGSIAPTGASLLAYASARAARRDGRRNNLGGLAANMDSLHDAIKRLELLTGRIESSVGGLRERVARVEGRLDGAPRGVRDAERSKP